jgi:hypothetical protein
MNKLAGETFNQTAPDKVELYKGGGCISIFGLPFLVAGLFILLIGFRIIPISNAAELPWWGWIMLSGMGLIFTAVGTGLVFGRSWITIDTTQRKIWTAWGLLSPMRGKVYDLDSYSLISLQRVAGDSDSAESFPVFICSKAEGSQLPLCSSGNYGASYEQATMLSAFLHLPLEDITSDHPQRVQTDHLTAVSAEPSINQEEIIPPLTVRSTVDFIQDGVNIGIPGSRFTPLSFAGLIIPLAMFLYFIPGFLSFARHTQTPFFIQVVFAGFAGLFLGIVPVISLWRKYLNSKRIRTFIKVNSTGLYLQQRLADQPKTLNLPVERIIGLDYDRKAGLSQITPSMGTALTAALRWLAANTPSRGILIKSRDGMYYVGAGLPAEEVRYLYLILKQQLKL